MKNQKLFDIVTLSDDNGFSRLSQGDPEMEPITIITAGVGLLQSVFPGLSFGGRSASQIAADERASMNFHKAAFLRKYGIQLPNSVVVAVLRPGWDRGENGTQLWDRIMNRFYNENKVALEAARNGIGPLIGGNAPGGVFTPGTSSAYVPYIIGAIAFFMLLKKK